MSKVQKILVIAASCMIVFAGFMLLKTLREYKVAENEYDTLNKFVTELDPSELEDGDGTGEEWDGVAATQTIVSDQKYQFARNYNRSDFPAMQIDFKGLKEINPEVVAWLYVGAVDISYPVMQRPSDEKNEYYLHHTMEGTENSSGSIFMDWSVDPKLTDWNTFIYGHNMKNGSMFGGLRKFVGNHTLYDKDPYIYVFREEGIYRYKIYSYYLDTPDSKMYWTCKTWKEYRAYVRTALINAVYDCKTDVSEEDNTVTLVTCNGAGAGKKRFFVHGISVDCYLYPPIR